jgi:hypothetical protein
LRIFQFFIGFGILGLACYLLISLPVFIAIILGTLVSCFGWILILASLLSEYQVTAEYHNRLNGVQKNE